MREDVLKTVVMVSAGILIGSSTTYLILNKRIERKYRDIAEEEIQSVKRKFKVVPDPNGTEADERARVGAYLDTLDKLQYRAEGGTEEVYEKDIVIPDSEDEVITIERSTITTTTVEPPPEFAMSQEVRSHDKPYVITTAEFEEDNGYDKVDLTYYEEDDTLIDLREDLVNDVNRTVGKANLKRFGHGSNGPDTLYVRNDRLGTDFEISRAEGTYMEVILGEHPTQ